MDAYRHEPEPEQGRAERAEIADAPWAVVADVPDIEAARALIEDLEKQGVPTTSIKLLDAETKDPQRDDTESDVAESAAFAKLSKSVLVGGGLGIALGSALGVLLALMIPDLVWYWGVIIGGLFGAAVGGAAGGMSVAKYSSPAWDETYQVEDARSVKVAVHQSEAEIVDNAESVMRRHIDDVERIN